ncbi:MAG: DUF3990 domain-containing protein [Oscillibacter sp.]|nr:DUF3990 domain-containing protein [Oscillibacter sp.]
MKVYHGSLEEVKVPEIRIPDRPLDYGSGFYTTTSFEQAETWVRRRMKDKGCDRGFVNIYDFDEQGAKQLHQAIFESPTDEWIDFVMANRIQKDFCHDYDIVYGPVANDRVYIAFALYEGGMIGRDELVKRLKTYKLVDQYLFHTEASLHFLNYLEAKEVGL